VHSEGISVTARLERELKVVKTAVYSGALALLKDLLLRYHYLSLLWCLLWHDWVCVIYGFAASHLFLAHHKIFRAELVATTRLSWSRNPGNLRLSKKHSESLAASKNNYCHIETEAIHGPAMISCHAQPTISAPPLAKQTPQLYAKLPRRISISIMMFIGYWNEGASNKLTRYATIID
jgi:hypothetical protein